MSRRTHAERSATRSAGRYLRPAPHDDIEAYMDDLEDAVKNMPTAEEIYRRRLATECSAEPDGQLARDLRRALDLVTSR